MDKLIYGKNDLDRIVSVEVGDTLTEIFTQEPDGEVTVTHLPSQHWLLANRPKDDSWAKLKGTQHYRYGKKFSTIQEYHEQKRTLRSQGYDIYSITNPKEAFLVKNGYTYFRNLKQQDVTVLSFDLETTALEPSEEDLILLISNTFRKNGETTRKLFAYDEYDSQEAMISAWCDWVREVDPSIVLGHNILSFDLKWLDYKSNGLCLGRDDSNLKFASYDSFKRIDGSREQAYRRANIYGREIVDTMFLAINYDIGKKYESYALKKIIAQEKLEKPDRTFYDASKIRYNYLIPEEWIKIKDYCIDDADDSLALFDLMAPMFFYLNQAVPKSFQGMTESATGSQINSMMVRAYLQDGYSIPKTSPVDDFEGAISLGNPGIYNNAFKVDVASLYPSIMLEYKIADKWKDPNGYLTKILEIFTNERLEYKKLAKENKYYDDLQNSRKVFINSVYGFLAAEGLNFNNWQNAALVTKYGREILRKASVWASGHDFKQIPNPKKKKDEERFIWVMGDKVGEGKGFNIVNADTDSITISNGEGIDESKRRALLDELNSLYPSRIHFEDDGYFPKAIILKAKNYILWTGQKVKVKGSAMKDAKKEKALKEFLNRIVESIINDTNGYVDIYHQYVKEAADIKDISRWSSKKTISDKVLNNDRANEAKIRDAIKGKEISEGDKVFMYYKSDGTLSIADQFDGEYDKNRMIEKVYKTSQVFANVLGKDSFLNYKLKRNQEALQKVIDETK